MKWLLLYALGACVTAAIQYKFGGGSFFVQTEDGKRTHSMGMIVTIVAWPIFLPIMGLLWLSVYIEEESYRRRHQH